jgi:hypothetical protein
MARGTPLLPAYGASIDCFRSLLLDISDGMVITLSIGHVRLGLIH